MEIRNSEFLSTGCEPLDKILGGGIRRGEITLIYGEPGMGKTSLAMQCALGCAKEDLKSIFIDSDNTFSLNRLEQMASNNLEKVSPLIFIFKPQDFQQQSLLVENLENYNLRSIALIIVDTLTGLYGAELGSTEKVFALNMRLNRQIAYLDEYAQFYNNAVILTSQVHSNVQGSTDGGKVAPVAARVLKFWAKKIISLESTPQRTAKKATLEIAINHQKNITCFYSLDKRGIVKLKGELQPPKI